MNEEVILQYFTLTGAVLTNDHFVYTGGKHGKVYVNKDALYTNTHVISKLCQFLAFHFDKDRVDTVIAPAIGGVILSQWTAHHLIFVRNDFKGTSSVYAEKDGDSFVIKRGYDKFVTGKRVLVVEDILTTGGSVRKVVEAVRAIDGQVVGVGTLCNRGKVRVEDIGNPPKLVSLINLDLETWDEANCPLCKQKIPVNTEFGKGREFLQRKREVQL